MVARTIQVYDSAFLTVAPGSPTLTPGSSIINNSDTPDGTIFTFQGGTPVNVTLDDTGGSPDVLEDDNPWHHVVTDGAGIVANGQGVEAESHIYVRMLDANGNPTGPEIDVVVFSQGGVTSDVWGFHSDLALTPGAQYVKVWGNNLGTESYSALATQPVCFAAGTLIETPGGPVPAEELRPGDLVLTADHGPQPVRWHRHETRALDGAAPDHRPIIIRAGALGPGRPAQDLVVSPQHRVLVGGAGQLEGAFEAEALVPAKALTALAGVRRKQGARRVAWVHFACDRHELVRANGALAETLLLGPMVLPGLNPFERGELAVLFGASATGAMPADAPLPARPLNGPPARACLSVAMARRILAQGVTRRPTSVARAAPSASDSACTARRHGRRESLAAEART